MLWRRFNDIDDLVGIVKLMGFSMKGTVGSYSAPFYGKRFPVKVPDLKETMASDEYIYADNEMKTHLLSQWVYRNTNRSKNEFNKAKDAFYYWKRMDENGY